MAIRIMVERGGVLVPQWATHSALEQSDPNIGPKAEALDLVIKEEIEQLEKDFLPRFQNRKDAADYFRIWWEIGKRLAWMTKVEMAHPDDFLYLEQACYDHMGTDFAKFMGLKDWMGTHYLERALRLGRMPWKTARCFGVWDIFRKLSINQLFIREKRFFSWLEERTAQRDKWIFADCTNQSYAYRNFICLLQKYFKNKDSVAFTNAGLYKVFDDLLAEAIKKEDVELLVDGTVRQPRDHKAEKLRREAKLKAQSQVKIPTGENHEVNK